MKKIALALLALVSVSAFAVDAPRNQQLLDTMITTVERGFNLKCEKGREAGAALNPLLCSPGATDPQFPGRTPVYCLGTVRYKCKDADGKKKFKVSATYSYTDNQPVALEKLSINATE